ncbi:MAG: galactokinase [Planctomycetota bacterium]|nr:galactokinase [Planctomycetota bacterium]
MADEIHEVGRIFTKRFGCDPRWIASAPGRVNLIGEHTDYNDGFVLPMAIDLRTRVLAAPATGDASTIRSARLDREVTIDLTRPFAPIAPGDAGDPGDPGDPGVFANYVLGVINEFINLGHEPPNFDLLIDSDIPLGAGLSSSAALEVAMATLLQAILGVSLEPLETMRLCQRAEHAFPGTPCGIMDQHIVLQGQEDQALLIDCRTNKSQAMPMPPRDQATLLIANTNVRHELASGEYATRRTTCHEVARRLGVDALRDATLKMLPEVDLDATQVKRATHVIMENTRTLLAAQALRQGDLSTLGDLLFDSHASLRDLYEVSCPELDVLVDVASVMKEEGVYGARMTGGGFGGCAIILCDSTKANRVISQLKQDYTRLTSKPLEIFETKASDGSCLHTP